MYTILFDSKQVGSYNSDLDALISATSDAASGAADLQSRAAAVQALISGTDPARLPISRVAAHKLADRLERAAGTLQDQAQKMTDFQSGLQDSMKDAQSAADAASQLLDAVPVR